MMSGTVAAARHAQLGGEPEGAARAGHAAHADFAAHQLRQLLADGEAQAGAAVFAGGGGVGLLEGLEQLADLASDRPMPWSLTSKRTRQSCASLTTFMTRTTMLPSSLNLMALLV
jgi:hypothetical protein